MLGLQKKEQPGKPSCILWHSKSEEVRDVWVEGVALL